MGFSVPAVFCKMSTLHILIPWSRTLFSAAGVSVIRWVYIIKCRKTDKTIEGGENEWMAQSKPQVYQPRPVFGFNPLIFTVLWHFLCGFSVVSTNIAWLGWAKMRLQCDWVIGVIGNFSITLSVRHHIPFTPNTQVTIYWYDACSVFKKPHYNLRQPVR